MTQYKGYHYISKDDLPTYACVGTNDYIANHVIMKQRLKKLQELHIPIEFHEYKGLVYRFVLGIKAIAEGWIHGGYSFLIKVDKRY